MIVVLLHWRGGRVSSINSINEDSTNFVVLLLPVLQMDYYEGEVDDYFKCHCMLHAQEQFDGIGDHSFLT